MKKATFALAVAALCCGTVAQAQHPQSTHWIEDAPVPMDGTYVQTCALLEVNQPKECTFKVKTEFEVMSLIFESHAARAGLTVGGLESTSVCTMDIFEGEGCQGQAILHFEATGKYQICHTVDAFPASQIGNQWDELGDENPNPEELVSDIHHWTTLKQDCGLLTSWDVVEGRR